VLNFPLGALPHVGLARAYALQGDSPKARAAYQDFFTLWKDADRDIPILQQAKAETLGTSTSLVPVACPKCAGTGQIKAG
jgi:hypothetical protein